MTKGTSDQGLATPLGHTDGLGAEDIIQFILREPVLELLFGPWEGRPRFSTEVLGRTGGKLKAVRDGHKGRVHLRIKLTQREAEPSAGKTQIPSNPA